MFQSFKTATGHICIMRGECNNNLEFVSLGDYGKSKNIKADFLGLNDDINGVPHGDLLPLSEKWVITISSQYGCSMNCSFCDVPKVGRGINATINDLINQVKNALSIHPEINVTERLNLHYARMGEPTWNLNVINSAYYLKSFFELKKWGFHPVVSTMMPKNNNKLFLFLEQWLDFKNFCNGNAGLQISINTTDEVVRSKTMPCAMSLESISNMFFDLLSYREDLKGRKITLNFALTNSEINANKLRELFNPKYFLCKITPMHNTEAVIKQGMITDNGYDYFYPYKDVEESLKQAGFDVLVFIPSKEEDSSKITCGNAILATGLNKTTI